MGRTAASLLSLFFRLVRAIPIAPTEASAARMRAAIVGLLGGAR